MRNLFFRLAALIAVAGVGLAGVAAALVPAARGLGDAGTSDEAAVDLGPLDQRSYVYASDGSLLTTLQAEIDRQPVPLAEISSAAKDAVLAVEDEEFYAHQGVNLRATVRALLRNVDEGSIVQGGSTITQQVIKSAYGDEQSLDRKAREVVLARRLEETMTKDEILERYLNTVYLGNGAYGLQAGAETYFGVSAADLDVAQSAFLAGMIANPSIYDPIRHPEASKARRDVALGRLLEAGHLDQDVHDFLLGAAIPTQINQVLPTQQDYFVEEVKQQLLDDTRLGETREEREFAVFRGGLRIHTTLDPRAQGQALQARNDVLAEVAPEGTPAGITPINPAPNDLLTPDRDGHPRNGTAAVVSVDPATGAVRAMVGGAGFGDAKFNVTTQGVGRSGGSTFKIFVLMALLERGYTPNDSVNGGGPCSFKDIPGMEPNPYKVENFANSGGGGGTITSQLLRSSNCAFVRLGQIVGIPNVIAQAEKMGITTNLENVVSMPLGTKEVYPIDMAGAVASIANDGVWNEPYYVDRVEDPDGKVLLSHHADPRRASSPQSARLACQILVKNVQSGTGGKARVPGQHAGGKTGTAQDSGNAWFVGFTPYLATAVWLGAPEDNYEVRIQGTGITGGSYPAEIWGRYMRAWHDGLPERECPEPAKITKSSQYLRMDVENDSGGGTRRRPRRSGGSTPTTVDSTPTTAAPDSDGGTDGGDGGDGGDDGGDDAGDDGGTDGGTDGPVTTVTTLPPP